MVFYQKSEVEQFIRLLIYLGQGSQGVCYRDSKNVYKFYHSYFENDFESTYEKEEILRFKTISSSTFLFPKDVIMLGNQVIGDITSYRRAKNLSQINPLNVSLDKFMKLILLALKDIEAVSKQGVVCYDMMYNILMGYRLFIVDTLEYGFTNQDAFENNLRVFNLEIMYFLVDGIFLDVVKSDSKLSDMYESRGSGISIIEFVQEFRRCLNKLIKHEITCLREAKDLRDTCVDETSLNYERDIMIRERILNLKS